MTALRGTAFVVGAALLGATAHATIGATGGCGTAHSFVTLTIAAGVAVSALVIGTAWRDRRGLAIWLVVAIIAGEAFGFLSTAERLIAGREAAQTPLRAAAEDYAKASQRVADAAAAMVALPTTSTRLEAAIAKKDTADRAATEKSAERGCRENCRQLLQGQVDEAAREVVAARAALADAGLASKGIGCIARRPGRVEGACSRRHRSPIASVSRHGRSTCSRPRWAAWPPTAWLAG